ncbi:cisplatin damage response ATP-dependent DNA ligase [Nevskia sp.]|jgi:DNA ligase-1|uniref:cisplatin damage response ATP-dependent DNA ligase n=1 Tax=Nevskia sp. TaxID=1929292 RepID=UPI003F7214D7
MKRFAALYARLDDSRATSVKVEAMRAYFAEAPAADAAWGLYFLTGQRLKRLIAPTLLRAWISDATGLAPAIVEECYAHVGDLAETLALLLDRAARPQPMIERGLAEWVAWLLALREQDVDTQRAALLEAWARLPLDECFLFNKLLTGALRVGVSSGLAARALALHAGLDETLIAQRLMGEWLRVASPARSRRERIAMDGLAGGGEEGLPGAMDGDSLANHLKGAAEAFAALLTPGSAEAHPSQPYPFCLASPIEDAADAVWDAGLPSGLGPVGDWLAEWKWDGIRGQLIRRAGQTFLWSRGEELLNGRFPEIEMAAARLPDGTVLDGEILAHDGRTVLPFAKLQTRIGRKTVGKKLLADAPVAFVAYDLIEWQGEDWRSRPLAERRAQLETIVADTAEPRLKLSEPVIADSWAALAEWRSQACELGVEGLMLKARDSRYQAGRRRGAWWKWKLEAMSIDCVLLYAQAGHGRRANLYTDYTLAVWEGPNPGEGLLLPVAKAYSGLTDAELTKIDSWIKKHTREKFGPVRSVDASAEAGQVFEIAFEGIQASSRHKAGVALRFPRIARWRTDKPAREANTLADLKRLLPRREV